MLLFFTHWVECAHVTIKWSKTGSRKREAGSGASEQRGKRQSDAATSGGGDGSGSRGEQPAAAIAAATATAASMETAGDQKKMSISSLLWNMSQKGLGSWPPTSLNERTGCARLMDMHDSLNLRFLMSTEFSK